MNLSCHGMVWVAEDLLSAGAATGTAPFNRSVSMPRPVPEHRSQRGSSPIVGVVHKFVGLLFVRHSTIGTANKDHDRFIDLDLRWIRNQTTLQPLHHDRSPDAGLLV